MEVANIWTNWEILGDVQWSMVLSAVLCRGLPLCLCVCLPLSAILESHSSGNLPGSENNLGSSTDV